MHMSFSKCRPFCLIGASHCQGSSSAHHQHCQNYAVLIFQEQLASISNFVNSWQNTDIRGIFSQIFMGFFYIWVFGVQTRKEMDLNDINKHSHQQNYDLFSSWNQSSIEITSQYMNSSLYLFKSAGDTPPKNYPSCFFIVVSCIKKTHLNNKNLSISLRTLGGCSCVVTNGTESATKDTVDGWWKNKMME